MMRVQNVARLSARQHAVAARSGTRSYATGPHSPPPPPAGSPAPNPEAAKAGSSNGPLWAITGVTALGVGAWWFLGQDDSAKSKIKQEAHKVEGKLEGRDVTKDYALKAEQLGDKAGAEIKSFGNEALADARYRAKAEDAHARDYISDAQRAAQQTYTDAQRAAQQTYGDAKSYAAQSAAAAEAKAAEARDAAAAKYGQTKEAAAAKYGEVRDAAANKYAQARAEAERTYDSARGRAAGAYDDAANRAGATYDAAKGNAEDAAARARGAAEDTKQEAKAGWFSWLGWGRAKKEEAAWEKDALKRDAADKVAGSAEDVRDWADGKKGETRQEKAGVAKRADQYTSSL